MKLQKNPNELFDQPTIFLDSLNCSRIMNQIQDGGHENLQCIARWSETQVTNKTCDCPLR